MKKEVFIRFDSKKIRLPKELLEDVKFKIGAYSRNNRTGHSLPTNGHGKDVELNKKILGDYLNADPSTEKKTINDFWTDINFYIPGIEEGLKLNIATDEEGYPDNLEDYIFYKHCLEHPIVANSLDACERDGNKRYYIYDPAIHLKKDKEVAKNKRTAIIKLATLIESKDKKIPMILDYFGKEYNEEDKEVKLQEIAEKTPKEFIAACDNDSIELEAMIKVLAQNGIIAKEGNDHYFNDVFLGSSVREVLSKLRDANKSDILRGLKAKKRELDRDLGRVVSDKEDVKVADDTPMKKCKSCDTMIPKYPIKDIYCPECLKKVKSS